VLHGGLLGELLYSDEARIIDELHVAPDDPSAPYFSGMRSAMAIPLFDQGVAMNMVVFMRTDTGAFVHDDLPEHVWLSNLFGRATQNLVLSDELRRAYEAVDNEMQTVAEMQRSLLPVKLPDITGLDVAVHYETSRRAGGDYYDFFPLPNGRWGIFIADVTGHGTPAAVLMAITHAMAHNYPETPCPPSRLLARLNRQLAARYTNGSGKFVTAFYAIYDPKERKLTYSSAGHPPPRLKRCADGSLVTLEGRPGLPLGIVEDFAYEEAEYALEGGDQIIFYTDGITEAFNPAGELFGTERLDDVLNKCSATASSLMDAVLDAVDTFAAGRTADDDRTLVVARVTAT
jgi:sigma-B regulation protein RsbU (phosphoserine phosphatase)